MEMITYETIRIAHRAEKEEELQKLPQGFFESVRGWLSHKDKLKDTTSLLRGREREEAPGGRHKQEGEEDSDAALGTVRGEMPPAGLTDDERKFFDQIVNVLKAFKNDINDKYRNVDDVAEEKIEEAKKSIASRPEPENLLKKRL